MGEAGNWLQKYMAHRVTRAEEKSEDQKEKSPPKFPLESPHHSICTHDVATSSKPVKSHRFGEPIFIAFSQVKSWEETGKLWAKRSSWSNHGIYKTINRGCWCRCIIRLNSRIWNRYLDHLPSPERRAQCFRASPWSHPDPSSNAQLFETWPRRNGFCIKLLHLPARWRDRRTDTPQAHQPLRWTWFHQTQWQRKPKTLPCTLFRRGLHQLWFVSRPPTRTCKRTYLHRARDGE